METFVLEYLKKSVSRETLLKLFAYIDFLEKWNKKINLTSPKGKKEEIWSRHMLDSIQIFPLIDKKSKIIDLGSGAGFPGMVLAIAGYEVVLIEKNFKKTVFLKELGSSLGLKLQVINKKIEEIDADHNKAEFITSRALSTIKEVLALSEPLLTLHSKIILFKSLHQVEIELERAALEWDFKMKIRENIFIENNRILVLSNVVKHKG